jgi:hypothetical protein
VAAVKAALLSLGVNLAGPCGAAQITLRVGWQLRGEGWGPIASDGNGCTVGGVHYRSDALMKPDGTTIDLLGKSESDEGDTSNPAAYNIPQWRVTGSQPSSNWRPPFDLGSPAPVPVPVPTPIPVPVPIPSPVPVGTWEQQALMRIEMKVDAAETARKTDHITVIAAVNSPGWFERIVKHPIFVAGSAALTTWITKKLVDKK